jgi:apolipoprotein N-acyltransferase
VRPGAADLIAWPENAILAFYFDEPRYRETMRWLAASREAPILFGTQAYGPGGKRPTNTTLLLSQEGDVLGRYDKIVLFPFTERRAFRWLDVVAPPVAERLNELVRNAWGWAPDGWAPDEVTLLELPASDARDEALLFWTPVCYESGYERYGREAGRKGARFYVNLTSEGWMGWALSNNQMAVNILRAVENRVGSVRVGNTGPSAFILPTGEVDRYLRGFRHGRLRLDPGVLIHRVALGDGRPTVYARIGDVLDLAWPLAWLGVFVMGLIRSHVARPDASEREELEGSA